jgi:hypothetical protein
MKIFLMSIADIIRFNIPERRWTKSVIGLAAVIKMTLGIDQALSVGESNESYRRSAARMPRMLRHPWESSVSLNPPVPWLSIAIQGVGADASDRQEGQISN